MPLKEIMNGSGLIGHSSGSPISGGVFIITSVPSVKVKAGGVGVHKTPLQYTFSGGNAPGFVPGSVLTVAPQTIAATAVKVKADSVLVMRVGDTGIMAAIGTPLVPPPPTAPIVGPVEIVNAGQTKVKGQ